MFGDINLETKVCFKCNEEKPLASFYKHKEMKDGHINKCIDCAKKDVAEHRKHHPELLLATKLKMYEKYPSKHAAANIAYSAVKSGVLDRPKACQGCGCGEDTHRIEAHHSDYGKPMDVVWLCTPCHREMDKRRSMREDVPKLRDMGYSSSKIAEKYKVSKSTIRHF